MIVFVYLIKTIIFCANNVYLDSFFDKNLEFKLGSFEIEEGAHHLLEIERLIRVFNEKEKQAPLRLPDLKIVITGKQYGYRREDGVFVIPIGCLKD